MDETVAAIARRELGRAPTDVRRNEEGLIHDTFEVRCDGREYVLQLACQHEDLGNPLAHGLNCYVALQDTAVPVPAVVTREPGAIDGRRYALVERLPGDSGERDVSPDRVRDAGRYLARIHGLASFEDAGWLSFEEGTTLADLVVHEFDAGSLAGRLRRKREESIGVFRAQGLDDLAAAVEDLFSRSEVALPGEYQAVLCHDDYTADNVLFRDDAVIGMIDFDFAHASDGRRDLAKAANGFWMHDPGADWDVREQFYRGYREIRPPGEGFERVEPLYRVETLASTVSTLLDMGELSASEREFYADRIHEAIARAGEAGGPTR